MEPPNDSLTSLVEERRRRDELWRAVLDDSNYLVNPIQDETPIDPADERSDLHRQKLQEVEQLMIRENGVWRCRHCNKTSR